MKKDSEFERGDGTKQYKTVTLNKLMRGKILESKSRYPSF